MKTAAEESKIVPIKEGAAAAPRIKLERIQPVDAPKHIAESWKLFQRAMADGSVPNHPSLSDEFPQDLMSELYRFISLPHSVGLIARQGRKPVGMILGSLQNRPFGSPKSYLFVWTLWRDPSVKGLSIAKILADELLKIGRAAGAPGWEATVTDQMLPIFHEAGLVHEKAEPLSIRLGGPSRVPEVKPS